MSGYGRPSRFIDKRKLTELQARFCDSYLLCNKNMIATTKFIGISDKHGYDILKSERVKLELASRCSKSVNGYYQVINTHRVSNGFKLDLLWNVAQKGASLIFDRVGNQVLMNGASAVRSIRAMNAMDGDSKPVPVVNVAVVDNRSVDEIHASIQNLYAEAKALY